MYRQKVIKWARYKRNCKCSIYKTKQERNNIERKGVSFHPFGSEILQKRHPAFPLLPCEYGWTSPCLMGMTTGQAKRGTRSSGKSDGSRVLWALIKGLGPRHSLCQWDMGPKTPRDSGVSETSKEKLLPLLTPVCFLTYLNHHKWLIYMFVSSLRVSFMFLRLWKHHLCFRFGLLSVVFSRWQDSFPPLVLLFASR